MNTAAHGHTENETASHALDTENLTLLYAADEAEALAMVRKRRAAGLRGDVVVVVSSAPDKAADHPRTERVEEAPYNGDLSGRIVSTRANLAALQRDRSLRDRTVLDAAQALEDVVRDGEERLLSVIDAIPHQIWQLSPTGEMLSVNQRWREYFGRSTLRREEWAEILHPDDLHLTEKFGELFRPDSTGTTDLVRLRDKDGVYHWFTTRTVPVRDAQGNLQYFLGTSTQTDDLLSAERAAQDNANRFRTLAEALPHLVWEIDETGCLKYANRRWQAYFGRNTLTPDEYLKLVHPEDVDRLMQTRLAGAATPDAEQAVEVRLRGRDGSYRWFSNRWVVLPDEQGHKQRIVGTSTDIDDLKQADRMLRESQKQLQVAIAASNIGLWSWDLRTNQVTYSDEWKKQLGYEPHEIGTDVSEWRDRIHPDDRERAVATLRAYLAHPWPDYQDEIRLRHKDGSYRWLLTHGSVLYNKEDNQPERLLGCHIDITKSKRLDEELRQAQKVEAVGRLAGGVAHDFNNLLTVILGQLSLVEQRGGIPAELRATLRTIGRAAERAASLTAQLLAFGRKQVMQPRTLDLNAVIAETMKMLERVLGEDVIITFQPDARPTLVHADPNQLVQVLLNLAVNARDAMPRGGHLRIGTGHEQGAPDRALAPCPHGWACISVQDSGSGIDPEVLPRIFEPFFTTKEMGKGTGLGLATVYGIVRQHGGTITVTSSPAGSTFKVYLPMVQTPQQPESEHEAPVPCDGHERILLVEDDQDVREVLQRILTSCGYDVKVARTAAEALSTLGNARGEVDLVVTDVVMPDGMSGCELAEKLRAEHPAVRILLTSGYSTDVLQSRVIAQPEVSFLQKPYSAEQLLSKVREVLDRAQH
jgi:two-component system cell cycle sensor histidine kinase/response regulator CckA